MKEPDYRKMTEEKLVNMLVEKYGDIKDWDERDPAVIAFMERNATGE